MPSNERWGLGVRVILLRETLPMSITLKVQGTENSAYCLNSEKREAVLLNK